MRIQRVPSAQNLMARVQQEGTIRIIHSTDPLAQQFGAFWDSDTRTIHIDFSPYRSQGEIIGSILFELHNASVNQRIEQLHEKAANGRISKASYVEALERLEYENSLNCARIAEEGIRMGLFPRDARLHTYPSFEEHFRMQKIGQHSAWIEEMYDNLRRT